MRKRCVMQIKLVLLCVLGLVFMGCMTTGRVRYPYEDGKKLQKTEMPSPEDHTLLFGNAAFEGFLFEDDIQIMEFIQLNPSLEPKRVYPGTSSTLFYLYPVKPDSVMQLIYWEQTKGNVITYSRPGIQKHKGTLTFTAKKPGLQYIGSYLLGTEPAEKRSSHGLVFLERDTPDELKALIKLKSLLTNTPWESVIDERLEELTHE